MSQIIKDEIPFYCTCTCTSAGNRMTSTSAGKPAHVQCNAEREMYLELRGTLGTGKGTDLAAAVAPCLPVTSANDAEVIPTVAAGISRIPVRMCYHLMNMKLRKGLSSLDQRELVRHLAHR